MKRLSKVILISLVVVLALAALTLGGLLAYVRSDAARGQIEAALGRALKIPVKFEKIDVSLPARLRVEGITTVDSGLAGQPKITAHVLRCGLALRPLLAGEFDIRDVVLETPVFDWPQNAENTWAWPSSEKKKSEPKPPKAPVVEAKKSSVMLNGVKLTNGSVTLRDAQQHAVFIATEVATDFAQIRGDQLSGVITAGRLVWKDAYVFQNVRTALRYAHDTLQLDGFEAAIFDGAVHGRLEMETNAYGQPFKTRLELRGVDLNALAKASGWADGEVTGRLNGETDLSGRTNKLARLEGAGRVGIENGRFKKLEFFGAIAALFNLDELANLQPREARAEFKLHDERVFIDPLVLATENLRIETKGTAKFDGKLALDARLTLSERMAQALPSGGLTKLEDGRYGLDFKITGKASKPKTDLAEKLIGGRVQDKVVDLLGGLFGTKSGKKKDDKHEKKEGEKDAPKPDAEKP